MSGMLRAIPWTSQPPNPVPISGAYAGQVIQAFLPFTAYGYNPVTNTFGRFHYGYDGQYVEAGNTGLFWGITDTGDDVRTSNFLFAATSDRQANTWVSSFYVAAMPATFYNVVCTNVSYNTNWCVNLQANGSLIAYDDNGAAITTASGIVSLGQHVVTLEDSSPTGSSTRNWSLYLDGNLVGFTSTASEYSNFYDLGPRGYSSPIHSLSTIQVNMVARVKGIGDASLRSNPWRIFEPQQRRILASSSSSGLFSYTNSATVTNTYSLLAKTSLSYNNSDVVSDTYSLKYSASLNYNNAVTSSNVYYLSYSTALQYVNNATATNVYSLSGSELLSYTNNSIESDIYALSYSTNLSYSNAAIVSNTYSGQYATALIYASSAVVTDTYSVGLGNSLAYNNTATSNNVYSLFGSFVYGNSNICTQNYTLSFPTKADTTDGLLTQEDGIYHPHVYPNVPKVKATKQKTKKKASAKKEQPVKAIDLAAIEQLEKILTPEDIAAKQFNSEMNYLKYLIGEDKKHREDLARQLADEQRKIAQQISKEEEMRVLLATLSAHTHRRVFRIEIV